MSACSRFIGAGTLALGLAYVPQVVRSEQENAPRTTWLGWLVRESDPKARKRNETESLPILKEEPGQVVVWGGKFGRRPRVIEAAGQNIVKVAAGDDVGAVIDEMGKVCSFDVKDDKEVVDDIPMPGHAVDVAVREGAKELVVLDRAGNVYTAKRHEDGRFRSLEKLDGPHRRARVSKIRCGKEHCIALTKCGKAFSWGTDNIHGQLATGGIETGIEHENPVPRKVKLPEGIKVVDAACGDRHTLFLDTNGDVFGVGDDHWVQLGISSEPWLKPHETSSGEVRKAKLLEGLAGHSIASGGQHSVMLIRDGTVFSFGFNQWGQLGHHNYSTFAPPAPIADYSIRAVSIVAGANHTCVVKENGELWSIGGNSRGQLGIGNLQPSMVWKKVRLGRKAIRPSFVHSLGNVTAVIVPTDVTSSRKD